MGCANSQLWVATDPTWKVKAAGCMFVDASQILVGLHTPHKRSEVRVCGLGGKTEPGESWYTTAIRETVEELFHISTVPTSLIDALACIHPIRVIYQESEGYVCIVYNLGDLPRFLKICRRFLHSPLYNSFPRTVEDLLRRRKIDPKAEIMQLILWPRCVPNRRFRISNDLMDDLNCVREIFAHT